MKSILFAIVISNKIKSYFVVGSLLNLAWKSVAATVNLLAADSK